MWCKLFEARNYLVAFLAGSYIKLKFMHDPVPRNRLSEVSCPSRELVNRPPSLSGNHGTLLARKVDGIAGVSMSVSVLLCQWLRAGRGLQGVIANPVYHPWMIRVINVLSSMLDSKNKAE